MPRSIGERLAVIPGVSGVTMSRHAVMASGRGAGNIYAPDTQSQSRVGVSIHVHMVRNDILTVVGTPILMGRNILASDNRTAPRVGEPGTDDAKFGYRNI